MSQVTEQSVRFQTALASIKLIQASAVLDLTEDDFDFLTSNKVWIATGRPRDPGSRGACDAGSARHLDHCPYRARGGYAAGVASARLPAPEQLPGRREQERGGRRQN